MEQSNRRRSVKQTGPKGNEAINKGGKQRIRKPMVSKSAEMRVLKGNLIFTHEAWTKKKNAESYRNSDIRNMSHYKRPCSCLPAFRQFELYKGLQGIRTYFNMNLPRNHIDKPWYFRSSWMQVLIYFTNADDLLKYANYWSLYLQISKI